MSLQTMGLNGWSFLEESRSEMCSVDMELQDMGDSEGSVLSSWICP